MEDSSRVHSTPFTRQQLRSAGHDTRILRRKDYQQVMRSAWVHRDHVDDDTALRAALAIHPDGAFASHFSAAKLLGLPVPEHTFVHVSVLDRADRRWRQGLRPHVTSRKRRIITVRGIPTTDPVTTFIQMAGVLGLVDLVVLGDALVKKFKISPSRLVRLCAESPDHHHRAAHRAAGLVRRGVDSPMETRLRLLIVLAGLPEPIPDVRLVREDGTWRRRFDLCYPDLRLIIEYDGRQHAESIEQWHIDLERREEFDDEGYRILVVTARGIFVEPERTIERVRNQLAKLGHAGPLEVHDGWREHFCR